MSAETSLRRVFTESARPTVSPSAPGTKGDPRLLWSIAVAMVLLPLLLSVALPTWTGNLVALAAALLGIWVIGILRAGPATSRLHVFYRAFAMGMMLTAQILLAHYGLFALPESLVDSVWLMGFCIFFGTALLGISRGLKLPESDPRSRYQIVVLLGLQVVQATVLWMLWQPAEGGLGADLLIRLFTAGAALAVLVDPGHIEDLAARDTRLHAVMANAGMALYLVVVMTPPMTALWPLYVGVALVYGPVMLWNASRAGR